MTKRISVALAMLATVSLIVIISTLAQSREITTKGYGTIYGEDKAAARDRAIEDAQRKAVEQAMGTMISSETVTQNFQLINDRILSLSSGYIETYRIVSEKVRGGELEIEIAAIVGLEKLNDSLQAIKNLIRRMDRPKLMVLVAEQSIREEGQPEAEKGGDSAVLSATSLGVVENTLIEFFRAKGFEFIDRQAVAGQIEVADPLSLVNDEERVKKIASLTDAQLVIFGQAQARNTGKAQGIYSGQANVSLRALKADTGEIIAATSAHAAVPFVDPTSANTRALMAATQKVSQKLMDQILEQWQAESSGTRIVSLIVKGASYADLKKFRSWLPKYARGIKSIHQRSMKGSIAELDIDVQGSAQNLADDLSEKAFSNKIIEVLDLSSNKVTIELK
ncbi:MAG: flagellar assembly protein T N-terminal domain-containing protein [Desulfobacterales bacterium]|jgi:hypothetical protein